MAKSNLNLKVNHQSSFFIKGFEQIHHKELQIETKSLN
jgi:hypothetical protein